MRYLGARYTLTGIYLNYCLLEKGIFNYISIFELKYIVNIKKYQHNWISILNSYESQEGYDPSEFKIQVHSQDSHVTTPAEFMQGCVKKLVGIIRTIKPVRYQLYLSILCEYWINKYLWVYFLI